jgi:hypothetical protein
MDSCWQSRRSQVAYPYDVSPDGRRFVVLRERSQAAGRSQLIVTVDWQRPAAALK